MKKSFIYLLKRKSFMVLFYALAIMGFSLTWVFENKLEISVTLSVISLGLFILGTVYLIGTIQMVKIRKKYSFDFQYSSSPKKLFEFYFLLEYYYKYGIEKYCNLSFFENEEYCYCYLELPMYKISFICGDIRRITKGVLIQFLTIKDLKSFYKYLRSIEECTDPTTKFNFIDFEEEEV